MVVLPIHDVMEKKHLPIVWSLQGELDEGIRRHAKENRSKGPLRDCTMKRCAISGMGRRSGCSGGNHGGLGLDALFGRAPSQDPLGEGAHANRRADQ